MDTKVNVIQEGDLSLSKTCGVHLICWLALGSGFLVARNFYGWNFITHYWQTTLILWVLACPFVLLAYSHIRQNCQAHSVYRAAGRGLLALPAGAFVNAVGAIILGAPVGFQYFMKTLNWSLLMSLFTCVPAACVYGSSWKDWKQVFAHNRPIRFVDYLVCLPAHGAVVGAWFGAWPMPLDWERPWQEWPICVTYGAFAGYVFGSLASFISVLRLGRDQRSKTE